jgi:hypothetical protein
VSGETLAIRAASPVRIWAPLSTIMEAMSH